MEEEIQETTFEKSHPNLVNHEQVSAYSNAKSSLKSKDVMQQQYSKAISSQSKSSLLGDLESMVDRKLKKRGHSPLRIPAEK